MDMEKGGKIIIVVLAFCYVHDGMLALWPTLSERTIVDGCKGGERGG